MIDIEQEHLVALHDVPKLFPARANGKRIHISAVYRWVQRGVRGVHLEIVRVGGTSAEITATRLKVQGQGEEQGARE